jgi:hypothetical protein
MRKMVLMGMAVLACAAPVRGQIERAEMTTQWQETEEILSPESGAVPPPTSVGASYYLGRLRLQDKRSFPLYELRYAFNDGHVGGDLRDLRLAGLQRLPFAGWTAKGIYLELNPSGAEPSRYTALYVNGKVNRLLFAGGLDHADTPTDATSIGSLRLKVPVGRFTVLAGGSTQPDDQSRWVGGGLVELPGQFIAGGMVGSWQDDEGFAVNFGRYNRVGDCGGWPSFSIKYLDVPTLYHWANFRLMWGDAGIHYVQQTFASGTFSGQYDIDMALMLKELVPDNYRHFDAPLVFKRADEYGKIALRANFIETPAPLRKFDANLSTNIATGDGVIRSVRGILSLERVHNPVFGWQDLRYHLTGAVTVLESLYAAVTLSTDFDEYHQTTVELRAELPLLPAPPAAGAPAR